MVYGANGDCMVGLVILQGTVTQSWKYVRRQTPVVGEDGQNILGKPDILGYKQNLAALTGTIGTDGRRAVRFADGTGIWIHEPIYSRRP